MNRSMIVSRGSAMLMLLAIASLPLSFARVNAQDKPVPDASIDGLRIGAHWAGPAIDKKALLGKVVLVEIWGQ